MKVEGSYEFDAPRDVLWPMLQDPDVLTRVMPGCKELTAVGENQYTGTLTIKVGPVQGEFQGDIKLYDIRDPESYCLEVKGKGAPGYVQGVGTLRLEEQDGKTILHYDGDAQVSGRLASVGQRLLDTSTRAIIRQSLEGLGLQVQDRMVAQEVTAVSSPPPVHEAPTILEFSTGVAKNIVEDLVPPENRDEVIGKGLLVGGALLLLWLFAEWWSSRLAKKIARELQR